MGKNLFTSNYTLCGRDPRAYAISIRPPSWYCGAYLREFAPTWDIVVAYRGGVITEYQYTVAYLKLLEERNIKAEDILDNLPNSSILLCYEKPNEFCHRHIVARWLMDRADVTVLELVKGQTPEQTITTNDLLTF